jgi:hypothetical protein
MAGKRGKRGTHTHMAKLNRATASAIRWLKAISCQATLPTESSTLQKWAAENDLGNGYQRLRHECKERVEHAQIYPQGSFRFNPRPHYLRIFGEPAQFWTPGRLSKCLMIQLDKKYAGFPRTYFKSVTAAMTIF